MHQKSRTGFVTKLSASARPIEPSVGHRADTPFYFLPSVLVSPALAAADRVRRISMNVLGRRRAAPAKLSLHDG
jgi:hypothetical protein